METRVSRASAWYRLLSPLRASLVVLGLFAAVVWLLRAAGGTGLPASFGMQSAQLWWYITRAAGLTGYLLIWLSMAWGLAIPSRIAQPLVAGTFTYDFHEHLSLLGLGFILLHMGVLLLDRFLRFSLLQVLIPFIDPYRPFWVGLGILSFYVLVVVTVTFYLRQRIGQRLSRAAHVFSLAGYVGATLHGLVAGTDSGLPVTVVLYAGSFLVIFFLTIYWLMMRRLRPGLDETRPG